MESALINLLKGICSNVRPDVAEYGIGTPYLVWQSIGGESINPMDNSAPGTRRTLMQISAWAQTRMEVVTLIRSVEGAMRGSSEFTARPAGEPVSIYEHDTGLHGAIQRFDIWSFY